MIKVSNLDLQAEGFPFQPFAVTPEKLKEILGTVKKIERLPQLELLEKGDSRKVTHRKVRYITPNTYIVVTDYGDERRNVDDIGNTHAVGREYYTVKDGELLRIKKRKGSIEDDIEDDFD